MQRGCWSPIMVIGALSGAPQLAPPASWTRTVGSGRRSTLWRAAHAGGRSLTRSSRAATLRSRGPFRWLGAAPLGTQERSASMPKRGCGGAVPPAQRRQSHPPRTPSSAAPAATSCSRGTSSVAASTSPRAPQRAPPRTPPRAPPRTPSRAPPRAPPRAVSRAQPRALPRALSLPTPRLRSPPS